MKRRSLVLGSLALLWACEGAPPPEGTEAQTPGVQDEVVANAATAAFCPNNLPRRDGVWTTKPYLMPINPISASLTHDGKVLLIAGSENDASNSGAGADAFRAAVWTPTGTTQSSIAVKQGNYDFFCSGTAMLPDGRAFVVGGTSDYSFKGEARASMYDPSAGAFEQAQTMADGRWYATATTLGDGKIMAFSGLSLTGGVNKTVEIYDTANGWSGKFTAPFSPPLFPRMALMPNGKVFFNGQGAGGPTPNGWIFDPSTKAWTQSAAITGDKTYSGMVLLPLLPPAYKPRVMNFGGGNPATSATEILDLSLANPTWTPGPAMSTGRIELNSVLLPSGKVLIVGGSLNNETPDTAGKRADLYDPVANTIVSAGNSSFSRLYHSTALLLPDATVAVMGSNPGPRGRYTPAIEIYSPAYLFDASNNPAARPAIGSLSSTVLGYGANFTVNFSSTKTIKSALLMRPGSTTHAFDMDQRLVGLCGPSPQPACSGATSLSLTTPANGNVAPPGWYMLFLVDSAGVPSKAAWVHLMKSPTATPPDGVISAPAGDMTITAGQTINFSTNTVANRLSWIFPGGQPATSNAASQNVLFASAGTYTVSMTAFDASGNPDPSPARRTIRVNPSTANFAIAVTPSLRAVTPGGSTTYTVTITPQSGFNGQVLLTVGSESGFPTGITSGGFNPPALTGGGTSVLTMKTTSAAVPYALSLTIKGQSGSTSHATSTSLVVNLAAPGGLTATPSAGHVDLSWNAVAGATGYHVKRSLSASGPFQSIGCTTGTTFQDTTTTAGTTYAYVVSASLNTGTDGGGESADSGAAIVTP